MHEAVTVVNNIIAVLNQISPEWYVVAVGPLANMVQHFLKKEREFSKRFNRLMPIFIGVGAGAFYGLMHTPETATLRELAENVLKYVTVMAPAIWFIATNLYFRVSRKLEELHELAADGTINPEQPAAAAVPANV
jgi:hypothetical protein